MSNIHHDCLSTKELHIVDEAGRTKVFISTDRQNSLPYMDFRDNDGRPRIYIALDSDGTPHITLFDEENVARASIGVSKMGAGISLFASNPEHHIILDAGIDGVIADFGDEADEDMNESLSE
jgi:hypothetical protein